MEMNKNDSAKFNKLIELVQAANGAEVHLSKYHPELIDRYLGKIYGCLTEFRYAMATGDWSIYDYCIEEMERLIELGKK